MIFDRVLAEWWEARWMPTERWHIMQQCGVTEQRSMHLALREWENLPLDLRLLLVNYARSGKIVDFPPTNAEDFELIPLST